jgi:hypothetical protein
MPDAGWAVSRLPPTLANGIEVQIPVSTSVEYVTTRHQRFTCVRLLKTHLTDYLPPFPTTLTTRALYPCSLWRFETCPCRPASGGRPPSPVKLRSRLKLLRRGVHSTRRVARGVAAPRSPRTGREPLDSSGSHHPAVGPSAQWANRFWLRRRSERNQSHTAIVRPRNRLYLRDTHRPIKTSIVRSSSRSLEG